MNKKLPLVSVIMTVYNAEKYIKRALDSILNQTYSNIEILITDDASTDNSKIIIDNYSDVRIRRYHNRINKGYLVNCNKLFGLIKGEFFTFQDADDFSHERRIELLVNKLLSNHDLKLCGSNFVRIDENEKIRMRSDLPTSHYDILNEIESKNSRFPILGGTIMAKKEVLSSIGGYRTFFNRLGAEHLDWMMLITEHFEVANIQEHIYYYRYVSNSFSRTESVSNYLKYYIHDIVYFFREQRSNFGYDALQNLELKPELDNFLKLKLRDFENNRDLIYKRVILNRLYNNDIGSAYKLYQEAMSEDIQNIKFSVFFYKRLLITLVKRVF